MANMPIAQTGRVLRCNEKSLTKILGYWVDKAVDDRSFADVKNIAIDETSFKKGHEYVSVVIDAMKRVVTDMEPGKDKSVVQSIAQKLKEKGGDCSKIEMVTSDMSAAFLSASKENFPNATHAIDKFHVKQIMLKALNKVRKSEQKESSEQFIRV